MIDVIDFIFNEDKDYSIIYKTKEGNTLLFKHPRFLFLYLKAELFGDKNNMLLAKQNKGIENIKNIKNFNELIWRDYNIGFLHLVLEYDPNTRKQFQEEREKYGDPGGYIERSQRIVFE